MSEAPESESARAARLLGALEVDLTERFPGFEVVYKPGRRSQQWVDRALRVMTFGGQSRYLDHFVTTFGSKIYVPGTWDDWPAAQRYKTLRHEAIHIGQFRRFGWVGMVLIYGLLPLPFGIAGGRAWLEWQAYRETLVATWQLDGPEAARAPALHDTIVRCFTGPDYAWMWLNGRTIRRAIDRALAQMDASPPLELALLNGPSNPEHV